MEGMMEITVDHISYRRRMRVRLDEIETTEPVPGYTAYWHEGERIVLTPEQKARTLVLVLTSVHTSDIMAHSSERQREVREG
jgi:hypothetical protein